MKVPCPLPLSEPWSPMGYQVVQIGEENRPSSATGPQVPAQPTPRSPLGYDIVKVADEQTPVDLPSHLRMPRIRRRLMERPKPGPSMTAPFVAIGGACLVGFLIVASLVISRSTGPQIRGEMADGHWRFEAVIPAEFKEDAALPPPLEPREKTPSAPAGKKERILAEQPAACPVEPGQGECIACAAPAARPGRDTFGTSVQFVRNPQETFRLARAERKLACLLHVSGNFEDSRFT